MARNTFDHSFVQIMLSFFLINNLVASQQGDLYETHLLEISQFFFKLHFVVAVVLQKNICCVAVHDTLPAI